MNKILAIVLSTCLSIYLIYYGIHIIRLQIDHAQSFAYLDGMIDTLTYKIDSYKEEIIKIESVDTNELFKLGCKRAVILVVDDLQKTLDRIKYFKNFKEGKKE